MRNAELWWEVEPLHDACPEIPHSAFRIPHSFHAFRISHSAFARRGARTAHSRLSGRRSHAAHRLQPPRPRSPHAARASLRTAPPRRRRAVARHGLAGGVRPAALRARQPAGGRVVRRPRHDLRARRPKQGIRAERSAPRPEDRAPGRPGDDLGPAGHPAQPARRVAARLRVPEERHAGDRGRDRRGAQRAPPRPGAGVCRVRGQRRRAAGGNPRGVPVARETRSAGGLAAALGARGPGRDESRRRGLGPAGRAWGGLDALLGSDGAGPRAMSAFVTLDGVRKQWSHTVAVGPLSLEIPRGEILVLLGPSGSGKTTVLRLLGGFETPDAGWIEVAGEDVTAVPPARRRCGMVFQHYALFPHLDVGENVAFGLPGRGTSEPKVAEVLALVGLAGFERRRVQELSGGQQQRVALARALAPEPRVLLLDEPLSNLDPSLRERTRRELRALIKRVGITTMFVTHEQEEAFDL